MSDTFKRCNDAVIGLRFPLYSISSSPSLIVTPWGPIQSFNLLWGSHGGHVASWNLSVFFSFLPYLDDPNNLSLVKGFIGGVVWALYVCVLPLPTPVLFIHSGPKLSKSVMVGYLVWYIIYLSFLGERGKIFMWTMIVIVYDMIITLHMNILP